MEASSDNGGYLEVMRSNFYEVANIVARDDHVNVIWQPLSVCRSFNILLGGHLT